MADYHVHSNYSDGRFLWSMARAAEEAGFDAVGFADHCTVSDREEAQHTRARMGYNLDRTYERRREALDAFRERFDLPLYDAIEMDYDPRDESVIERFLDEAAFDYTIGSVHYLDGVNVHFESYFGRKSEAERRDFAARYVDELVALAESELFDVAAHPDLLERNPAFRGLLSRDDYVRLAAAFRDSSTIPEINAGRVLDDYGDVHPTAEFLEVLLDHGVELTLGTDSHAPEELAPRARELERVADEYGIDPVRVV
ncbi:histidinol-phosphatase [Salinigranum rubrum]|uniref:histidinol-phosphatase n=1 Tax=Salinigranum rubrum TaxID=755307 RepID=A0A2I8VQ18_9EURY|nr:histidinol-phosphatase [Salinigranum rubrum]